MSTEHLILDQPDRTVPAFKGTEPSFSPRVRISLDERSCKFDLYVDARDVATSVDDLTFEDLRKIRDRIDEVLGYYDEQKG